MCPSVRPICEVVVTRILPTFRGEIAVILSKEYDIRQKDIANMLGITQASVSLYLNASRGQDNILMELYPEIPFLAAKAAKTMIKKAIENKDQCCSTDVFCSLCKRIQSDERFVEYCMTLTEGGTPSCYKRL